MLSVSSFRSRTALKRSKVTGDLSLRERSTFFHKIITEKDHTARFVAVKTVKHTV